MFGRKMRVRGRLRWWDKSVAKSAGLTGVCTKDEQIEIYQTLYARAAKERDEANARVRDLESENKKLRDLLLLQRSNFEL